MAFKKKIKSNQIINGTFGKLWVQGEKVSNVKSFESKVSLEYEDVNLSEELGVQQKYVGYAVEGTIVLHQVDSEFIKLYNEGIVTGNLPEVTIVAAVDDPASLGAERIQFLDVTLDEIPLTTYETKTNGEVEVPFKAGKFIPLDLIA